MSLMLKHANRFLMSWLTFGKPMQQDTMQVVVLFCFRVCSSHSSFILGHPAPHPKHVDVKPDTEGPRKGLLPPYPRTVHKENWLRGAWPTDKNGVAQFTSKFLIVESPPRLSTLITFISISFLNLTSYLSGILYW